MEKLQFGPDNEHYTDKEDVKVTKRKKLIGKAWDVASMTIVLEKVLRPENTNADWLERVTEERQGEPNLLILPGAPPVRDGDEEQDDENDDDYSSGEDEQEEEE